jgi:hypothetical protein
MEDVGEISLSVPCRSDSSRLRQQRMGFTSKEEIEKNWTGSSGPMVA